jgi:hypothetical protein
LLTFVVGRSLNLADYVCAGRMYMESWHLAKPLTQPPSDMLYFENRWRFIYTDLFEAPLPVDGQ